MKGVVDDTSGVVDNINGVVDDKKGVVDDSGSVVDDKKGRHKYHFVLTPYSQISAAIGMILLDIDWGILVVNEMHTFKNPCTKIFKHIIQFHAEGRIDLTGIKLLYFTKVPSEF